MKLNMTMLIILCLILKLFLRLHKLGYKILDTIKISLLLNQNIIFLFIKLYAKEIINQYLKSLSCVISPYVVLSYIYLLQVKRHKKIIRETKEEV
jgi:hypothetical protein